MPGMLTLLGIGDSNVAQQQREAGNSKANNEESSPSQSFTFLGGSKSEIVELKSENRRKAAEKLKQYLREAKANNNSATYILQLNMQLEVM